MRQVRQGHKRRGRVDAEKVELGLEVVAHVLTAVVVTQGEAGGGVGGHAAKMLAHSLADGLQGVEPRAGLGRVQPDAFGGEVVNGPEDRDLAVGECDGEGRVGAPQHVRPVGDDGAVMRVGRHRGR